MNSQPATAQTFLIVSATPADAALVSEMLAEEPASVMVSIGAEAAILDIERRHPVLVLLVFRTIRDAETCRQGMLLELSIPLFPHRTVVLCAKEEVDGAYDMWRRGLVDDYVVFWPLGYDLARLRRVARSALDASRASHDLASDALLSRRAPDAAPAQQRVAPPLSGRQPVILIADEDRSQRTLARQTVEEAGYRVQDAGTGIDALNILRRNRVDLILLDSRMPDINGLHVLDRVKAEPPLARIPIIMMTSAGGGTLLSGLRRGAADFMVKPIRSSVLKAKVARVLDESAAHRDAS